MGSKPRPKHWQTLPELLGRLVPKLSRAPSALLQTDLADQGGCPNMAAVDGMLQSAVMSIKG